MKHKESYADEKKIYERDALLNKNNFFTRQKKSKQTQINNNVSMIVQSHSRQIDHSQTYRLPFYSFTCLVTPDSNLSLKDCSKLYDRSKTKNMGVANEVNDM